MLVEDGEAAARRRHGGLLDGRKEGGARGSFFPWSKMGRERHGPRERLLGRGEQRVWGGDGIGIPGTMRVCGGTGRTREREMGSGDVGLSSAERCLCGGGRRERGGEGSRGEGGLRLGLASLGLGIAGAVGPRCNWAAGLG